VTKRYLEDLAPGQRYGSATRTVGLAEIQAFAREFDPQPFHLDPEAAKHTVFGELVASGWHTMAITMRLIVEGETRLAWGFAGAGVEGLDWPNPVRPGDTLRVENEVLEIRPSRSRPDRGMALIRTTTYNQHDEPVLVVTAKVIVPKRNAGPIATPL
jgi:acyl dehydratase